LTDHDVNIRMITRDWKEGIDDRASTA
jgi:hypothetical protein